MLPEGAMQRARLFLAACWAGGAVLVAAVATVLNQTMADRVAFGQAASDLFRHQAWMGLGCGAALMVLIWCDKSLNQRQARILMAITAWMLACIVGYFVVQPMMAALREGAGAGGVMASSSRREFGLLHGISMLLYLSQTVLAVLLVFKSRK